VIRIVDVLPAVRQLQLRQVPRAVSYHWTEGFGTARQDQDLCCILAALSSLVVGFQEEGRRFETQGLARYHSFGVLEP